MANANGGRQCLAKKLYGSTNIRRSCQTTLEREASSERADNRLDKRGVRHCAQGSGQTVRTSSCVAGLRGSFLRFQRSPPCEATKLLRYPGQFTCCIAAISNLFCLLNLCPCYGPLIFRARFARAGKRGP